MIFLSLSLSPRQEDPITIKGSIDEPYHNRNSNLFEQMRVFGNPQDDGMDGEHIRHKPTLFSALLIAGNEGLKETKAKRRSDAVYIHGTYACNVLCAYILHIRGGK